MAIFLDTGFIIALKNSSDIHHEHAVSLMERSLKNEFGTIYTSTFVFDEVVTLILIRLKFSEIAVAVGRYLMESRKIHLINVTDQDFQKAWQVFQKYHAKGLSFTDCTNISLIERLDCQHLATYDKHFQGIVPIIEF